MIKNNINKTPEEEESAKVQIISKPLKLETVNEGSNEDDILVRGADNTVKYISKSSLGGSTISVTKSELDNLINNNSLIPDANYKISGVQPSLYDDGTNSGTTIFLQALTENTLSKEGHGLFYNPKYDRSINGFNIWNSKTYTPNDAGYYAQVLSSTGNNVQSIVVDSNGVVYTANANPVQGGSGVTKILPNGTRIDIDTSSRSRTDKLCIGLDDVVYMIGGGEKKISKLDSSGVLSTLTDLGRNGNSDICVDSDGNVYVANYTYQDVVKILPNGSFTIHGTCGNIVLSMCLDNDANVYVTNSGSITKILQDGTTSNIFAVGIEVPQDICFSRATGNLYVSNASTGTVTKILPDGTSSILARVPFPARGICLDTNDDVIVLYGYTSHAAKIMSDGSITVIYDNPSFYTPFAVCSSGNDLYFVNMDSNNVIKLSTDEPEQSHSIGDKTIWGGYSWTNNSGTKGQYYDQFTLSYDWTKDQYNEDNYNPVLDIIEYDYSNDRISRRYEIESGSDVIYSRVDYDNFGRESAIKAFQFGNPFNSNFYKGISNITVSHSYFENINFAGSYQRSITLNSAEQSNCIFGPNSYQEYLTFSRGSSQQNVEFRNNSGQIQCDLKESSSSGNYLLPPNSTMSNLSLLKNSNIYNISPNEDSLLLNPSILKEIYNRPDGTTKIRYYDNDDNLVISDIND
ncbi:hypothetical protein C8C83_3322 [Flavobacterium sp. 90]|uniref:hypothetical protein n=1 Tax=unclassified Flavobacterium TaxID=196869 RepID=UPI000EB27A02|nr:MULTISPECIES: hypothetical protein [unclassified Flavobacterium]RKR11582.1 hypothetical protein C8C82_3633 [Flavobacterium sp. 81]TCK55363.1 hypothetical protein C8C83_3322 [Flavobacterium sp. 90]